MDEKKESLKEALWGTVSDAEGAHGDLTRVAAALRRLLENMEDEHPPVETGSERETVASVCFYRRADEYFDQFYTFLEVLDLRLAELNTTVETLYNKLSEDKKEEKPHD